jgi:allantoicase
MIHNTKLEQLKSRLIKVENELSNCRTSALQDGWQTQRHAKKSRKWDILAQRKMDLIQQIDEIEHLQKMKK